MRRLFVVVVFLPEAFLELRIGLVFGRLAQSARDDVVVVAAGLRAAAAATAATHALALGAGGISRLTIGTALLAAGRARGLEIPFAPARSTRARGTTATVRTRGAVLTYAFGTALAMRIALLGDALLLFLQRLVEIAERIVEAL